MFACVMQHSQSHEFLQNNDFSPAILISQENIDLRYKKKEEMGVHFAKKTVLLHLLLVLYINGSEGGREMAIPMHKSNVLRLHSMDHQGHAHANNPTSSHIDPSLQVFFTLNDLIAGNKLQIYFPFKDSSTSPPLFLPKNQADSIPFSSKQLPHLLQLFSFSQGSPQAKAMENTIGECEMKPIKGETKHCATSLESMLDYVRETFGSNTEFNVLSTTYLKKSSTLLDNYTIFEEPKEIPVPRMVACHDMPYPYTVFYCHSQETENRVFSVSLGGDNGGRVDAIAVCHMDTSQWSRHHASFLVLGIKPGSSHVCHFFRQGNLVYIPVLV